MTAYVKSFLVLFVLLALLLYLPPGRRLQKYIRFFAGLILMMGLLSPALSFFFDSEAFLQMIRYEEFAEELAGISRDMERIEYVEEDYMIEQYERAIAEDVMQLAGQYGYEASDARVRLTGAYEVAQIELWISKAGAENEGQTAGGIVIGEIVLGGEEADRPAHKEGNGEEAAGGSSESGREPGAGGSEAGGSPKSGEETGDSGSEAGGGPKSGEDAGDSGSEAGGSPKSGEETGDGGNGEDSYPDNVPGAHGELVREIASYYRVDPSVVRIYGISTARAEDRSHAIYRAAGVPG